MKFSIKDFFIKCDQTRMKLLIWSHLLKKSLMENFIFLCSEIFVNSFWIKCLTSRVMKYKIWSRKPRSFLWTLTAVVIAILWTSAFYENSRSYHFWRQWFFSDSTIKGDSLFRKASLFLNCSCIWSLIFESYIF